MATFRFVEDCDDPADVPAEVSVQPNPSPTTERLPRPLHRLQDARDFRGMVSPATIAELRQSSANGAGLAALQDASSTLPTSGEGGSVVAVAAVVVGLWLFARNS